VLQFGREDLGVDLSERSRRVRQSPKLQSRKQKRKEERSIHRPKRNEYHALPGAWAPTIKRTPT
jgi:hypothetical protein